MSRMARKKELMVLKIIEVAMTLFKEKSVDGVTMEEIAEKVDIAKGTLYNYFKCKEAIIAEFMRRKFVDSSNEYLYAIKVKRNVPDRMKMVLELLLKNIKANDDIFEKYIIYRMGQMISFDANQSEQSGFGNLSVFIIKEGMEKGELRDDIPMEVLCESFDFIFIQLVKKLYQGENVDSKMIDSYVDFFMKGGAHE